jgi:hypothetical protein
MANEEVRRRIGELKKVKLSKELNSLLVSPSDENMLNIGGLPFLEKAEGILREAAQFGLIDPETSQKAIAQANLINTQAALFRIDPSEANSPELLSIGRSAIELLHEFQLQFYK